MYFMYMLDNCGTWALYKIFYKMKLQLTLNGVVNGVFFSFYYYYLVIKTFTQHQLNNQTLSKHLFKV